MKKTKWIKVIVFLVLLYVPWFLWDGIGKVWPSFREPFTFTLLENRNIYELEDGFENYYNDRIPFRTLLVRTYNRTEKWLDTVYKKSAEKHLISLLYNENKEKTAFEEESEKYDWLVYGEGNSFLKAEDHVHEYEAGDTVEPDYDHWGYTEYICKTCGLKVRGDFVEKEEDTSYLPPNITANRVIRGRFDWLYQTDYEDFGDYRGTDILTEEELQERKKAYEDLQAECEKQGKELIVLTLPSKLNVYDEYMPTIEVVNEYKRLPQLRDWMKENCSVHFVCPWDELKYMDRYYPTYYRYDTHWNSFGGYIGAQAVAHEMGTDVVPLTELDFHYQTEPTGNNNMIGFGGFEPSDFTIPDYDLEVDYRPNVNVILEPDWNFYEYTSDGPIDKHLTLLGDSFRESMGPYLAKDYTSFSSILQYDLDPNFCEAAGLGFDGVMEHIKKDILEADVILLEATEMNEHVQFEYAKVILEILQEGK